MKLSKTLIALGMLINQGVWAHAGHYDSRPWQVCNEKSVGDKCAYDTHDKRYVGTCQSIQKTPMCVRNQPIESFKKPNPQKTSKQSEQLSS